MQKTHSFAEDRGAYAVAFRAPYNNNALLKQQLKRRGPRQISASSAAESYKRTCLVTASN